MLLSEYLYCLAMAFKMTEWVEQRICIKFCIKFEHSFVETIWMIQKVFRDDARSAAQIRVWHKCFKDVWESVESDPCSGRSATSRTPENIECVGATISKDQKLTVQELHRSWSGDSKNYRVWEFDIGCWHEMFHSFCYQSRRNIVLQLLVTWFKPMNQISSKRSYLEMNRGRLLWRQLRHHCPMYNVLVSSSINVSVFIVHGWILSVQTMYAPFCLLQRYLQPRYGRNLSVHP